MHLALRARGASASTPRRSRRCPTRSTTTWSQRYGAERVGLLTGDNAINGDAPVVVMTTEVLRNMLYAGSPTLKGLSYVVMDEVHYLADRFRGAVWEEVIIHLPESVTLVSLSATVSNAEEFADWLVTVRGETDGRGQRAPAGAALAAHAGRQADVRPVPRRRGGPEARRAPGAAALHPGDAAPAGADRPLAGPGGGRGGRRWRPRPAGDRRAPRPRGAAAGDPVHLQPGRLRRRRPAVPAPAGCG